MRFSIEARSALRSQNWESARTTRPSGHIYSTCLMRLRSAKRIGSAFSSRLAPRSGRCWRARKSSTSPRISDAIGRAEGVITAAQAEVERWQTEHGVRLTELLEWTWREMVGPAPDLRSPVRAIDESLEALEVSIERVRQVSAREAALLSEQHAVASQVDSLEERHRLAEAQISAAIPDLDEWARLIAEIASRIDSQVCPICDRDFGEADSGQLADHVAEKLSRLTRESQRLSELTEVRTQVERELAIARDRRDQITDELAGLPTGTEEREFRLTEAAAELNALRATAVPIAEAIERINDSQLILADERLRNSIGQEIAAAVARIRARIAKRGAAQPETTDPAQLSAWLDDEIAESERRRRTRDRAGVQLESLRSVSAELGELRAELESLAHRRREVERCLNAARAVRESAKSLQRSAETTHDAVIRSVFNQSLNAVWRDLFIRLAPGEPFGAAIRGARFAGTG